MAPRDLKPNGLPLPPLSEHEKAGLSVITSPFKAHLHADPFFSQPGSSSPTDLCPRAAGSAPRIIIYFGADVTSNRYLEYNNVEICGTYGLKNRWDVPLEQQKSTDDAPNGSNNANPQAQMRPNTSQQPPSSIPGRLANQTATTNASSAHTAATQRATATGCGSFTSDQLGTLKLQIFAFICLAKNLGIPSSTKQ